MTMTRPYIRGIGARLAYYSRVNEESGCWEWMRSKVQGGYGQVWRNKEEQKRYPSALAHRVAYELFVGPIPDGWIIVHLCRNPGCINPDHLEAVPRR